MISKSAYGHLLTPELQRRWQDAMAKSPLAPGKVIPLDSPIFVSLRGGIVPEELWDSMSTATRYTLNYWYERFSEPTPGWWRPFKRARVREGKMTAVSVMAQIINLEAETRANDERISRDP